MTSIMKNNTIKSNQNSKVKPPNSRGTEVELSGNNDDDLQAETIEVVPELISFDDDSEDDYNDFSEDDMNADAINQFDLDDNDEEEFDEYGYQVSSNHYEPETILFDNSELRTMRSSPTDSDVILIDSDDYDDDDDDDADSGENGSHTGGLTTDESFSDTGERRIHTCDICHRKVASSYNLKRHMMIHTGEKPFGCDICNRRFREFSDLKKHRKVHSTEKQFKCMVCNQNRPSAQNATKCAICEQKETAQKLQDVTMDQLMPRIDGNKKEFVCSYCDRTFGSSSNLKRHIMIHTGEKPFTCPICQRSFREMSTLKKHSFTHRKYDSLQNSQMNVELKKQCLVSKSTTSNLIQPEIRAKPEQSTKKIYHHKCPKCSEIFYDSSKLMLHICTVHAQYKNNSPVPLVSGRKSTKSPPPLIPIRKTNFGNLNTIQNGIVSEQLYNCTICAKSFRTKNHLLSHQLLHNY